MNTKVLFGAIILLILVSIQYTLNLILREIKSLRITMIKYENIKDINLKDRR